MMGKTISSTIKIPNGESMYGFDVAASNNILHFKEGQKPTQFTKGQSTKNQAWRTKSTSALLSCALLQPGGHGEDAEWQVTADVSENVT